MRHVRMLLWALLIAPAGEAQRHAEPGMRVRVTISESQYQRERIARGIVLRGELTDVTADSVFIRLNRFTNTLSVARRDVWDTWVSAGVPSRRRSMFTDGLGGVPVGILAVMLLDLDRRRAGASLPPLNELAVGAGLGFAVYGAIGFWRPNERWRRVQSLGLLRGDVP